MTRQKETILKQGASRIHRNNFEYTNFTMISDLMSRSPPNVYLCNGQLVDEVFVIFTMMKVEVSVVS